MTKPKFRKHSDGTVSMYVGDGFANFISGLGNQADLKARGNTYVPPVITKELETAYRTSTWFGKIVDIPADDATREWRTWQLESEDVTKVEAEERRLGVREKVRQARIWQRLYGGAAIIIGGPNHEQPLEVEKMGVRSIPFLTVLPRDEITPGPVVRNPLDENHSKPQFYQLNSTDQGMMTIHASRVVPFVGTKVASVSGDSEFWGDPIWFRLEDAVKSSDSSGAVLTSLLQEAKIDILRVSGMMKGMATQEYESLMIQRFTMVAILKGLQNVMLLDKDDEWQQKTMTWTGLPDVAKHILNILSGASDIPMFRLTGQNLTGLANTGEAEQRAYYDSVNAGQNLHLRPTLNPLDNALVRSALGHYPEDTWYNWNSLYQMTDKEKAEIDKLEADTASVYSVSGLIPSKALSKAVQARMIESGRWAALESALEEFKEEDDEGNEEDLKAVAALLARNPANSNRNPDEETPASRAVGDAAPRTLYVRRDVKNWEELANHFKSQGFETTLGADMHVTVVYSKAPVDWMKVGSSWEAEMTVPEGGPRLMEAFGENGDAKVLLFASNELNWRHDMAKDAGASYDFPEYQPHITISWAPGVSLEGVEPYTGKIVLGPEIFEEINEDWKAGITEDSEED